MIFDVDLLSPLPSSLTAVERHGPSGKGSRSSSPRPAPSPSNRVWSIPGFEGLGRDFSRRTVESPSPAQPVSPPATSPPLREATPAVTAQDDFVLRLYLRDIGREPLLTPEAEFEVAWNAHCGDLPARERLVLSNLRLVVRIAFEYQHHGVGLCDLINEGNLSLMRASELFDPTRGVRFCTYAAIGIRQRMKRLLSYQGWGVRLPADFAWQQNCLRVTHERLLAETGEEPSITELAENSGLTPATIRRLRANGLPRFLPLDELIAPDSDRLPLAEVIADEHTVAPDEHLAQQSDHAFIAALLEALKPRDRRLLRLRFGLEDGHPHTLEETGRILGLVRQRVQQLEAHLLARLHRRALAAA